MKRKGIYTIHENVIKEIRKLREEPGKDIWLVGGAEITALLLKHHLIDEIIINYIPVKLKKGIKLFSENEMKVNWKITNNITYPDKVCTLNYQRI